MKPEPTPRRDGCCVVCGKQRPPLAHDAFCSTVCCRVYFDTTLIITTSTVRTP
jgi:heterodisulfide reductase subunit A-like polyferredoxin